MVLAVEVAREPQLSVLAMAVTIAALRHGFFSETSDKHRLLLSHEPPMPLQTICQLSQRW